MLESRVITTGNEELDLKLGGGLPIPSLLVVEGGHGTGKSVLVQQLVYGALRSGLKAVVVATETTTLGYIRQALGLRFDFSRYYLRGDLRVYSPRTSTVRWISTTGRDLLRLVQDHVVRASKRYDVYAVDSLSALINDARTEDVGNFLNVLKRLVDEGKTFVLSIHSEGLTEETRTTLRAVADGYMELKNVEVGGRALKALHVVKLRGAPTVYEGVITFEVDPAFGIKLVPMALAKV